MVNFDEVVAEGATIQAAIINQKDIQKNLIITNINPLSLGMDIYSGDFNIIIPKNTSLSCSITKQYETPYDKTTEIAFNFYQGERPIEKDNYYLNDFIIKGLKKASKG